MNNLKESGNTTIETLARFPLRSPPDWARVYADFAKGADLLSYGGDYPGAYFLSCGLFLPWELASLGDEAFFREGLQQLLEPQAESDFAKIVTLEASCYMRNQLLRDTDWAKYGALIRSLSAVC